MQTRCDPVDALLRDLAAPPRGELCRVVLRLAGGCSWPLQPTSDVRTEAGYRIELEELPLWIRAHPDGWFVARLPWSTESEEWQGEPERGECEVELACSAVIGITRLYREAGP